MKKEIVSENKLTYHKQRIEQWLKTGDCAPIYAEIGVINICNHNCVFCGFDQERGRDILDTQVLLRNLENLASLGLKSVCYSGAGEPLLHKDFPTIIRKTKEYGIDAAFSTNAVLFNKEKAEKILPYTTWIRFSVDAATGPTHMKIHNSRKGDFEKIKQNLENAVMIKKQNNLETTLGVQFILLNENVSELENFIGIFKRIGVDNVQIKPYSQHPTSKNRFAIDYYDYDEINKKLQGFNDDNFQVISRLNREELLKKEKGYPICLSLPFWTLINERGEVVPCHIFYSKPDFVYGNIYQDDFSKIWESQKRKDIVKRIYSIGTDTCNRLGCRGDSMNEFLNGLITGRIPIEEITELNVNMPRHVNFI